MTDFVQLWVYLASTPLFGLTATLATYAVASAVYDRTATPLANPVFWSVVCIGALLLLTRTPYPAYFAGAQFVHVLLGPAVVALAWPLWERRRELGSRGLALVLAALLGGLVAGGSAVAMAWAFGMPGEVLRSLASKSVTAPVAMGIADRVGGVPALAAVFAVVTGLVGALSGKTIFNKLGIGSLAVRGFALGTTSHGIGAARALQVHPDAGAYAGMALGLQAVLASLLIPLLFRWFGWFGWFG